MSPFFFLLIISPSKVSPLFIRSHMSSKNFFERIPEFKKSGVFPINSDASYIIKSQKLLFTYLITPAMSAIIIILAAASRAER